MQQQPLEYETPRPSQWWPENRRWFGRIVVRAWVVSSVAFLCAALNAGDDHLLQWPAAIVAGLVLLATIALTLLHWLVVAPVCWYCNRKSARQG